MISRIPVTLLAVCALLLLGAPALAHGWQFTMPEGGGMGHQFQGAVGGQSDNNDEGGHAPVGGGDLSRPIDDPGTTGYTGPTTAPRTPTANRTSRTGSKGARRASPNFGSKKALAAPWLAEIRVPWQSRFVAPKQGYDPKLGDLDASLREGGWDRAMRPSVVMLYDPSQKSHLLSIQTLNKDARFRAAAHLFNCFRVDARALGAKASGVVFRTYDAEGKFVAEVAGSKANKLFDTLRTTWKGFGKNDLSKITARADAIVSGIAWCDHHMKWMETKIICPDCGHEREDVVESLGQMKVRRAGLERALSTLD